MEAGYPAGEVQPQPGSSARFREVMGQLRASGWLSGPPKRLVARGWYNWLHYFVRVQIKSFDQQQSSLLPSAGTRIRNLIRQTLKRKWKGGGKVVGGVLKDYTSMAVNLDAFLVL